MYIPWHLPKCSNGSSFHNSVAVLLFVGRPTDTLKHEIDLVDGGELFFVDSLIELLDIANFNILE